MEACQLKLDPDTLGRIAKWYLEAQPSCNILSTARLDRICTSTTTRSLENRKLLAPKLASGSRTKIVQEHFDGWRPTTELQNKHLKPMGERDGDLDMVGVCMWH
ncbi:uncharacterized protein LOC117138326 [Drosophila mauritiana]|uniref:Uncharacterized protein LOC117138326 n=1 Tax=Drosophila mauritiana TaxID=7226 RepID=A0A6P8JUR8_DROMA|nr:uncharacterized protein LOC117138326 [Drosophila mauritiana]